MERWGGEVGFVAGDRAAGRRGAASWEGRARFARAGRLPPGGAGASHVLLTWRGGGMRAEGQPGEPDRWTGLSGRYPAGRLALVHAPLAEQQPVEGDALLQRERDEKVGVRGRPVLVAIHVLLEHAEIASELPLRSIATDLGDACGELLLESLYGYGCHGSFLPCVLSGRWRPDHLSRVLERPLHRLWLSTC